MEKKYEILKDTKIKFLGREVYRIRALKDFSDVKKGDIGGYVESEKNLSQEGDCWIYGNAIACDYSIVCGNAVACDYSIICNNAVIRDNSVVCNRAIVCEHSVVKDNATVCNHAFVKNHAIVGGDTKVCDKLTN